MQRLNKKTIIYISMIIICSMGIYYFFIADKEYIESDTNLNMLISEEVNKTENSDIENNEIENEENNKIIVYITGAVKNEGIYELEENSRIADAIEISGGLTEEANINDINLAYILEDGVKVYIPKTGDNSNDIKDSTSIYITKDNSNTGSSQNTSSNAQNKININTATQDELETLPGIGPSIAEKIINYRKENGKFTSIEDIKKVSGIGDSKYAQIKDLIKV